MGEVYLAHDERLDRDVAIKVLPEEVVGDPDRLARFEREAKAVAILPPKHPRRVRAGPSRGQTLYGHRGVGR